MISFAQKGNFSSTERFLKSASSKNYRSILEQYAQAGVSALSGATPVNTGKTASSWSYVIEQKGSTISIVWTNSNIQSGVNIALILQYGHGTKNGGYVQGMDYINPALRPIFDKIADAAWKEVSGK